MRASRRPALRIAAVLLLIITVSAVAWPALADPNDPESQPTIQIDPSIQAVWEQNDGQIVEGNLQRAWILGPEPIASSIEYYPESPTGYRELVYYDKGRLELNDPTSLPGSNWLVQGGSLVSEMLSGRVQLGEEEFVRRPLPQIAIVGDAGQPDAVTYADLAPHSTVYQAWEEKVRLEQEQALASTQTDPNAPAAEEPAPETTNPEATPDETAPATVDEQATEQTEAPPEATADPADESRELLAMAGRPVDELLTADGEIVDGGADSQGVTLKTLDQATDLYIASVFADWVETLPAPTLNLIGLPVTAPYWVQATIEGESQLVLIQAFERRILTYTPGNPDGWQVESANVGLHYRDWRGLVQPELPELVQLAAAIPFGEEVLRAAKEHYIDPYILAAVASNIGMTNPFADWVNGGRGILGARATEETTVQDLADPFVNAQAGATQFATYMYAAWDWPTILANYYTNGNPNWDDPDMTAWVDNVMATYNTLLEKYPPSGPRVDPLREEGHLIGEGHVAYYSPSYTPDWWVRTMGLHASWGNAVEGWQPNPNGFYCVHPDYLIGEVMKVEANGRVVECTIGDMVAVPHQIAWRANWVLEMSWDTFKALGLDTNNNARVYYMGNRVIEPTPVPETPVEVEDPVETETPPVPADEPVVESPAPEPTAAPPTPTAEPSAPPAPSGTETPTATAPGTALPTATPSATPSATAPNTVTVSPTATASSAAEVSPTPAD